MRPPRLLCAALMAMAWFAASAQPLAIPAPPAAALEQKPGAQLPLQMDLWDEQGRPVRLGDYFEDGRPVLLVLGYYRCPQLCGLLMHRLLEGLRDSGLSRHGWRIVGVSIDPEDTPETARQRREQDIAYAEFLMDAPTPAGTLDLHLLVATPARLQRLARDIGFGYTQTPGTDARFAHPAAVMVATTRGKISRYLTGMQFDAAELRVALAEAKGERIGILSQGIALLCAHFDPRVGAHSTAVMNATRVLGLLMVAALAAWCWRRRRTETRQ
ncbi:hypothetical protein H6CHR_01639 [Variovorax sp. PBL-H6]|uniref:SCO family protein n=1 Tax=Variovorax sp. PBL-H6 TaxID=434009 RepID=UPI001315FF46|nr:SCO family protein [Variovorax sp. PBL-H6]VTU21685.1 hypothetical protein H6CHR_01639 [Variovorax sp. PBL-H6]